MKSLFTSSTAIQIVELIIAGQESDFIDGNTV